ncbi:protein-methionine sulfoxide oxidase mical3a isoform X7 [Alosa alosa]|uniref:protein-methionine sulfoxide oxidase mical3a isoform X7 n=1 Tax=Alosa alosa TaxID=278164 RepID=UPI00201546DD|nr:protein-methionine sulfoxide oxidase mical3a isoform X7 [Alosa alosa]
MADRGGGPGVGVGGVGGGVQVNLSHVLFDRFVQASTCKGTLKAFQELCDHVQLKPTESRIFYHKLKSKLNYWKAKALWAKLDKRASQKDYKKGRACANSRCVIIGAGPCGLRTAIELAFLGAKVVLLEKRDAFSRNNVLHLWPYTIQDLRGLGAKKFYGKFCAGSIDHISIRQLQLMLLKVALLLGIEIHVNVEFKGLIEPPEDQENERIGWRAEVHPRTHPVNELEFDVIIGADGRRNTLAGFRRKEFRGKLAIAITANFINRNTTAEASVEEISGVAFIFNQKFFQDLREATGIDLENIVYYKDDTHYFVMTAKKQSLLEKGVILHDYADTEMLLSRANVDQAALLSYAREAADFSTNQRLPALDFAINHYGQPDVAMFDFTCMYASENAALVRQRHGHQLLVALVGDSLLEPFWPMGTGIARGFLAAMDSAWMVRSWAQGKTPLEVLAERESIYRLLPQTTPENVSKNFSQYSVDPTTRYPNISLHLMRPNQVRHLIDTGESKETLRIDMENVVNASTPKLSRNELRLFEQQLQESVARSSKLLNWCQRQTEGYRAVAVTDLTTSWKSGMALCALIHRYRPDLIDFDSLDERDVAKNNQLAFDVAEREFGISPIMTGKEMSVVAEPDKLSMVMYLSQFYEMFKDTLPPSDNHSPEERATAISNTQKSHPISFLKLHLGFNSRKRTPKDKKDEDSLSKKLKTGQSEEDDLQRGYHDDRSSASTAPSERKVDAASAAANYNKIKSIQTQLQAKFVDTASNPAPPSGLRRQQREEEESMELDTEEEQCFPPLSLREADDAMELYDQQKALHVLSIQERTDMLASHFSDGPQPQSPPKPMKKPSRFFIEQWLRTHAFGEEDPPPCPQTPPQVSHPSHLSKEREVLRSDDQLPLHIPSIQERAERLAARFKDTPPKPKTRKVSRLFTEQWYRSREQRTDKPHPSPSSRSQRYVKMYTGGSSSLAEQIANPDDPDFLVERRDLGSLRKEFPQNIGGSDVCYFCQRRVYVMERLSAEGKFFHRSCFSCDYCGTTLRLSSYAFDVEKGKFYCKPHYCYRASGQGQKKRPAPASVSTKEAQATDPVTVDSSGRPPSALAPAERRPSVPEMNGVGEPSMAKRLRGTPERIELENYRLSLQREEELEEVPEETLAEHNLSSVLDKATDVEEGSSSSESDMEDEDEEEEERQPGPSDLGGVPWKEAVEIHAKLKGDSDAEAEGTRNGLGPRIHVQEDGEMEDDMEGGEEEDEEEEEEEEDDEDDESSDARNLRLQQALQPVDPLAVPQELCRTPTPLEGGQEGPSTSSLPSQPTAPSHTSARHEAVRAWLDSLSGETCGEEEDPEAEAGSLNIEPGTERDYDDIPSDAEAEARLHQTPDQEEMPEEPGRPESLGRVSSLGQTSESPKQLVVDVVLSPIPKAPQPELGEVHAHGKSPPVPVFVMSPGARFFPEVFRTDAAELPTPSQSPQLQPQSPVFSALFAPVTSPAAVTTPVEASPTDSVSPVVAYLATVSPEVISPGPVSPVVAYLATVSPEVISPGPVSPVVVSPAVASPAAISPAPLPASATSPTSPIRSQPLPLPETPSPKPPTTQPQSCACTPSANPLSPICAQTLPCQDPSSPLSSSSPVRTQPFPAATSTPASKPTPQAASTTPLTPPIGETDDSMEVTPAKKDIIEEFWQKSAEIRKSLGLTPLNRTRSVEQRSSVLVTNETTPAPSPGLDTTSFSSSSAVSPPTPKPRTPEVPQALEDLRPSFPNGGGRSVIRRLNITLEGQLISPAETKNSRSPSERREPSSSSGLGLNGSGTATSDSASVSCASDSTLLTPPSSPPPPPPPDEEPATLKHKVTWDGLPLGETDATGLEKTRGQLDARTSSPPPPPPPPVSCSTPRDRSSSVPTAAAAANTTTTPIPAPRTGPVGSCVVMRRDVKPRREQARKSFAESVEEIPFADDVEDTYDDRTPETSANERFFTPPTSKKDSSSSRPPLHLALAMENGKPNIPSNLAGSRPSPTVKTPTHISPEAKEIAEERMRAREKSVKSQVLKDAMAKQLSKMKEPEAVKDAMTKQLTKMKESDTVKGAVAKVAWTVSETTGKHKKKRSSSPKMTAVESLESKKQAETLPERFFTTPSGRSQESSVASSESSAGSKSKKRSSLFSPRKNKKEKKSKGEGRGSGSEDTPPKHKSLWKAVFSGYKKDKKKKEDKSCPSTPSSSSTTTDSGKKKGPALERSAADLKLRKNLSFSEDSDISCDDILERSSQKSKADHHMDIFDLVSDLKKDAMKEKEEREKEKERLRENERMKDRKRAKERENVRVKQKGRDRDIIPELERGNEDESVYVPHALAFKRSYATKKTYTEEELNAKLTRRVQKAARRQAKQEELKRLHRAQIIQRQLEQVEEKQRQLEERGVAVEKALRGEAGVYKSSNVYPKQHKRRSDYWGDSNYSEILDLHLGGMGKKDDPKLMQEWFKLVQEKNALVRYESELMIFARELELEDRQSRLQQELRERMAVDDHMKAEEELAEEKRILNEMLEVVEQRDSLVALLEEQRLQEKEEDKDLESVMLSKGFNLNWA